MERRRPWSTPIGSAANGFADAISISGGDVYVAGIRGYNSQKDTVPYSTDSAVYPVTGSVATVWKNGSPLALTGYGSVGLVDSAKYANRFYADYVNGIFVSGSDVYVSGGTTYQSAAHARYWKNGNPVDLAGSLTYVTAGNSSGFPQSTGIFVAGNDVYVSGLQQTSVGWPVAIYWKDGSPVFLSTDFAQRVGCQRRLRRRVRCICRRLAEHQQLFPRDGLEEWDANRPDR